MAISTTEVIGSQLLELEKAHAVCEENVREIF